MFHYPSAELMREKQKKRKPEIGASSPYVDSDYQITQVEEKLEFFVRWTLSFIVFFLTNGRTKYSITRELTVTCFLSADRSLISTKMRLNWPKARYERSSILLLGWLQCPPFPLHQSATPTWFFFSLFLFLSFSLSIFLSFYLSIFLSFYLSLFLSFYLSIFLSFYFSFSASSSSSSASDYSKLWKFGFISMPLCYPSLKLMTTNSSYLLMVVKSIYRKEKKEKENFIRQD